VGAFGKPCGQALARASRRLGWGDLAGVEAELARFGP
jgi:hypothetical protein